LIRAIKPLATPRAEVDICPALNDPAVKLCAAVWESIFRATLDETSNIFSAKRCANVAFRMALPPLSGYQNICDFIACVGYGILVGSIKPDIGTKLLYAAQVALGAIPQQSKTQTRTPAATQTRTSSDPHPSPTLVATQ
jgi:hypothetical protein